MTKLDENKAKGNSKRENQTKENSKVIFWGWVTRNIFKGNIFHPKGENDYPYS